MYYVWGKVPFLKLISMLEKAGQLFPGLPLKA